MLKALRPWPRRSCTKGTERFAIPRGGSYVLWEIETAEDGAGEDDGNDEGAVRGTQRARRGSEWARGVTSAKVLLVLSLRLSIFPEELLLSDYILSSGHPRCPRTYMRSSFT